MLGENRVKSWLGYMRVQQAKRLRITVPKILHDLEIIAFSNIKNYVANAHGQLDIRPGLPKSLLKAVKQYSIMPARISGGKHETAAPHLAEIELHDKLEALCELLKYFKGLPFDDGDENTYT